MLLIVCYSDVRYRIISNRLVIILFLIILIDYFLGDGQLSLINALICLIIGMILFYIGLVGAGDIKLISVLLLSLPSYLVMDFVTLMALFGIPLALIAIVQKRVRKTKATIPYGVAISLSYILISGYALYK